MSAASNTLPQASVVECSEGAWDAYVAQAHQGHLLQSSGWARFKAHYGWQAERVAVETKGRILGGVQTLYRSTPLGVVGYVPRGPVTDLGDAPVAGRLFEEVHRRSRRRGAIYLKVEPNAPPAETLAWLGFGSSSQCLQPRASIHVDLTPAVECILTGFKSKTRYNIGLAQRRGVEVYRGGIEDVPVFHQLLWETARRDRFFIRPADYYRLVLETLGEAVQFFLARYQGQVLAGIMISAFGPEAIYLYGASSNVHRSLMPNHLLQWEAMRWAKERGCTRYDMWGVPGEVGGVAETVASPGDEPDQGLWGVYRFKRGFSETVVRYAGAFDYVYSPARFWLWQRLVPLVQRLRGSLAD